MHMNACFADADSTHDVEWLMEALFLNGLCLSLQWLLVQCSSNFSQKCTVHVCLGTTYVIINHLHRLHSTMQGFVDVNLDYWATTNGMTQQPSIVRCGLGYLGNISMDLDHAIQGCHELQIHCHYLHIRILLWPIKHDHGHVHKVCALHDTFKSTIA